MGKMTEDRQSGDESSGEDSTPPQFNPTEATSNMDQGNLNGNEDGLKTEEVQDNLNNENEEDELTSPLDESLPEIELSQSSKFRAFTFGLVFLLVALSIGCAFAWGQTVESASKLVQIQMDNMKERLHQLLLQDESED